MKICVFGAASNEIDNSYIELVERLGKEMAKRGHSLVFGAGGHGLMGAAARGVYSGGGKITGVIPNFFKEENIELHKIELLSSNENETIDDVEEKLKILNNIQRIRADRRSLKNESYYISKFKKQDDELINIGLINYILGEINSSKNNHKNCGSMKKFKYKGFKERMRLVRDLEKRYDKVVINEKKMEICCYNNIGGKR